MAGHRSTNLSTQDQVCFFPQVFACLSAACKEAWDQMSRDSTQERGLFWAAMVQTG